MIWLQVETCAYKSVSRNTNKIMTKQQSRITFLIFAAGTILTSFSFYWSYRNVLNQFKEPVIFDLPYIKMSIIFTLISLLVGLIYQLDRKNNLLEKKDSYTFNSQMIIGYWFLVPVIFLLVYPGTDALKIHSDSKLISAIFSVSSIQCSILYCFSNRDDYARIKPAKYIQLFIFSLLIIFTTEIITNILINGVNRYIDF